MCCQCLVHANRFDLVVHAVCAVCLIFARYVMETAEQRSSAVALRSAWDSKLELQLC